MRSLCHIACLVLLLSTLCGCAKSPADRNLQEIFPPNMTIVYQPIDTVWQELLKLLRYEYLYTIEVENRRAYFFSTELIRDDQNDLETKYRLSGTLKSDGKGIAVVLYRQIQVLTDKGWMVQPTDYRLEHAILMRLNQRLAALR